MRKKKIKVLVLILCVISQIFLIFTIPKIENRFLKNDTWEKATKNKIELPQLSFTLTWAPNGTIISVENNDQIEPQICNDGAGGAIITWKDYRTGSNSDIYAQRIDSSGNVQWTADGEAICTASNSQNSAQICSDGAGGAIITWKDYRTGSNWDIYTQRIDSSGNVQWTADGVAICTTSNNQYYPQICSDGAGGAIITWFDYRTGSNYDIYAQRIDSSGNVQWTANGVAICTANNHQEHPVICSDGAGGAIITWYDYRTGFTYDIVAQRIDSSGNVQWTANGVAICTAGWDQTHPQICSDGAGGAIITWVDLRSGSNYDIYAQRVDSSGNVQWIGNGVAICIAGNYQLDPRICSDGAGGAIITWVDPRSGSNYDIYAQRVDSSGNVQWTNNGVVISTANNHQEHPEICSDGIGGAIITWEDSRSGSRYDIYAQRVNSSGNVQWTNNGVAICTANDHQRYPVICSNGAGSAITTWQDYRSGSVGSGYDIYAQRIVDIKPIYIASPENKTYIAPMSGYYPAVFGFENDIDGNWPAGWTIDGTSFLGGTAQVIDVLDSHSKVVELWDTNSGGGRDVRATKAFDTGAAFGDIEFWLRTTDATKDSTVEIWSSISGPAMVFHITNDNWTYPYGVTIPKLAGGFIDPPTDNTWYHVRIAFEATTGLYEGLNQWQCKIWVDGEESIPLNFNNNYSPIDQIRIRTRGTQAGYYTYFDAVGYSWHSDYNIGDNLFEGLLLNFENTTTLDWMGYSMDGQTIRTILGNKTFPIPDDGPHTVQVFGNTSIGFMIQSDIRHFSVDTISPSITINTPSQNDFFGAIAPDFDISIVESNKDSKWYTIDDGATNITFTGLTGTIDQAEWEKLSHGPIKTIRFYANDTFGKDGQAEVIINKDINAPISIISFIPHSGTNIVNRSTTFSLSANDGSESGVLSIRYKVNNSAWTDYTGLFTLSTFLTGDYIISYYAIDVIGNIEVENTLLVKLVEFTVQEPLPDMTIIILTASIIGGIGLAIVITIILIKKRK